MSPPLAFGRTGLVGFGLLLASFVVGALTGAAVDRVLSADEPDRDRARQERNDDGRRSYVIDKIDLGPDQRAAIDAILERRSERMKAVWRESGPRIEAITDSARAEIMSVLTPEQREEYERRLEERHRRRGQDRDDEPRRSRTGPPGR